MSLSHHLGGIFGETVRKATYIRKVAHTEIDEEMYIMIDAETGKHAYKYRPSEIDPGTGTILNSILSCIRYFIDAEMRNHAEYSFHITQRNVINQCLSEYPKLLYYHGAHLNAFREDCSLRNRKLKFLGFNIYDYYNYHETLQSPSMRDYLLSIGAGIGLDHDAYRVTLKTYFLPFQNPLITSEDYPAQLFIGADEKLLAYFQDNGFYRNGVDSVEKLHTLLVEEKLTEEDQDRLVNQALFARKLNIFNSEITRSLACVLGRLLYPNPAFHNVKILKAYVDFYNALIIAYHEKSATEKNSSGAHLLQTVLHVGTGLTDDEFPKLLDAVEDVNRGMRLRR